MPANLEFLEPLSKTRKNMFAAYRMSERECLDMLLAQSSLSATQTKNIHARAEEFVNDIRRSNNSNAGFKALLTEYDLSSSEGVALMCLAEAILRIPDKTTIEKLITDKISHADWALHLGRNKSKFVNSTTWSLFLTGKLLNLNGVLPNLIRRCGEPIVRQAVTSAIKMLCKQFVLGQTINEALQNAAPLEARGYLFSYDMLGEEARTTIDAEKYFERYMQAIEVIGKATVSHDEYSNPGISIKLSALHPRFEWRKRSRVLQELVPKLIELAQSAQRWNLNFTLDAEEADRLDLLLDVFTAVFNDDRFSNWQGLGIAVQAYQKRATYVITYLTELARSKKRRINVRLVKGAYWDSEIKMAQERGLSDYPVFTRKTVTDISYTTCAQQILAAKDALYAQFATHNAYTAATILELSGSYHDFEFQSLYGMGDELYDMIAKRYKIPCRIYAPVGHYSYLFGYLIRRLLENGANNSFVNLILDQNISTAELIQDPYTVVRTQEIPNPKIPLPPKLYSDRPNSHGIDYTNPMEYAPILDAVRSLAKSFHEQQIAATPAAQLERVLALAKRAANVWSQTTVEHRVECIQQMATLLEEHKAELIAILVLEGHKTIVDATAEVREAIDFCWYYALCASKDLQKQILEGPTGEQNQYQLLPRGVIACISPWNFPLAIFLGQILAAVVTGNTVIAKPARQTPRIAERAIELLHKAGIPKEVVQLVIGSGAEIGDALVQDQRISGVMLTGSTATAWRINKNLAARNGPITPLVAETGGQNVMIVDSSALPEQVVIDVITSAFGSAGQRCSCLRVLYVQEDIADVVINMLRGAMAELIVSNPQSLATDIGPVIDAEAFGKLLAHKQHLEQNAKLIYEVPISAELQAQNYFPPCAFIIESIAELKEENFGPILHVIRYSADKLQQILNEINATSYGLTLGIHSRIDDTVDFIVQHVHVGNIYVNRNMIGAIVGVQPFGGEGLSGTGPKAGGPYYLPRLTLERSISINTAAVGGNASLLAMDQS